MCAQEISRSVLKCAQTGWFRIDHFSKCILESLRRGNHPVCGAEEAIASFSYCRILTSSPARITFPTSVAATLVFTLNR